jgi:hypothetical protein
MKPELKDDQYSLHKGIRNHWIWDDPVKLKWWLDLLFDATHPDEDVVIGGETLRLEKGDFIGSVREYAKRWNVSKSTAENFFYKLRNDGMISKKSGHFTDTLRTKNRHLTICNYGKYNMFQDEKKTKSGHFADTLKPLWKKDYEVYLANLRDEYKMIKKDAEWIATQEKFNPGVDVLLSIEKACVNFWATEAGWKHKKKGNTETIDWQRTLANAISNKNNKVYKNDGKSTKADSVKQNAQDAAVYVAGKLASRAQAKGGSAERSLPY